MIRLTAYAKINLYLEITGKLPNGYHTLDTIFQTISLGDRLTFKPAKDLRLTCTDKSLPVDDRNLAMRAALRLRETLKEKRGAHIHLQKITPMGAGLGGGSADAASVLQGLLKLWRRTISPAALKTIAVGLGADVPFFLKSGTCAATGIGDQLKSMKPLLKTWMVIVWPGFGISTKEAYGKVKLPLPAVSDLGFRISELFPKSEIRNPKSDMLFNRFESLVFADHPELPRLKKSFLNASATATLMSGSGSAVFGLARSQSHAKALFKVMHEKYPHCWIAHTL